MTDGLVMISTHDLARAGSLRTAFTEAGYATDLVTPTEELDEDSEANLLVLTGDAPGEPLATFARDVLNLPIFVVAGTEPTTPALRPGVDETFPASASVQEVVVVARRVIERRRLREMLGIIGDTDAMQQVLERVVQIAPTTSTVLVTGESGTGKELVARGIHALSPRLHQPFIAVNVAALSDTLLESELFGHEKGAFTGAIDSRKGLFELADGGTIFLDEIGEMPLATQTKLLRVLEQREFHRVGGEQPIKVDVRIVAATNQDLRKLVSLGEFRRDLFFRLNVLSIELPPLRDRRDDIPLLIESFVRLVSKQNDLAFPGISAEAMEILVGYPWPGNIRELRNLVESMVVLSPGRTIRPEDIPDQVRDGGSTLLPAPIPRVESSGGSGAIRPELEFVFRTLVDLRVDMDDLRRDFEAYRTGRGEELPSPGWVGSIPAESSGGIEIGPYDPIATDEARVEYVEPIQDTDPDGVVVFRPGMTMEDMEREAIAAALEEVRGNRRKAAELLGIGERTLYRKISKYGLDASN